MQAQEGVRRLEWQHRESASHQCPPRLLGPHAFAQTHVVIEALLSGETGSELIRGWRASDTGPVLEQERPPCRPCKHTEPCTSPFLTTEQKEHILKLPGVFLLLCIYSRYLFAHL